MMQQPNRQPRVAVIILTWNRIEDLVPCLESFSCLEYPNYHVIVVDNASQDDTVATVRKRFAWATLIVNEENLGYVGGNNVGMKYALEKGFDYIFILNSDTKVTPTVLSELVRVMESDHRIAITGAKNLLMENPRYTWGRYGKLTWGPMLVKTIGRFELDHPEESPKDVEWIIGNGCMMSREALDRVGLFDEEFFQVNEDVDWSLRARKLGYRIVFVDSAAIYHQGGSSGDFKKKVVFAYGYFLGRNAIMLARKHANVLQWAKLLTLLSLGLLIRTAFYAARGFAGAVASDFNFVFGMADGFRGRMRRHLAEIHVRTGWKPLGNNPFNRFLRWLGA
jgi:GT2 family glycosyltransferase